MSTTLWPGSGVQTIFRPRSGCPDTGHRVWCPEAEPRSDVHVWAEPGSGVQTWAEPRSGPSEPGVLVQTLGRAQGVMSRPWAEPGSGVQTLGSSPGVLSRHWAEPGSLVQYWAELWADLVHWA